MIGSLSVVSFQVILQRQDGISFKAYWTGYCCPVLLYCHILGFTQCMQHFLSVDSVNHMITGVKCYNYILLVLFWRISTEEWNLNFNSLYHNYYILLVLFLGSNWTCGLHSRFALRVSNVSGTCLYSKILTVCLLWVLCQRMVSYGPY